MAKKFKELIQFYPNAKKGKPEESEGTLDTQNGMPAVVVKEQKNDQMEITHKSGRKETAKVHMTGSDYHIVKNKHGQQFTVNKKGHVLHGHGNVNEESELDESMTDSWKNVQSMDKGSLTGGKEEAKKHLAYLNAVHAHHKKYGNDTKKVRDKIESINRSRIAEDVIAEGAYEKSEENKRSADAAKKQGDMFAHHLHMSDHHDNLAQWHSEKGRHSVSDMHAKKSEEHHEKAMKLKEEYELEEGRRFHGYQSHSGPSHGHAYGGSGFGRRRREDDEYHNEPKKKPMYPADNPTNTPRPLKKEEVEHTDYLLEYPEDLQKMKKADSYKVGDKVFTKVGGKWHKGHVTTPLNKAGNHGVKFQHGGKIHSYVSSPEELRLHVEEVNLDEAAPFKDLHSAVKYASDKVKTHRDHDDGIEVYKHKSGGYDVNHTMNSSGRNSLHKSGAKHLGTVYKDKPHNIKEETLDESQAPVAPTIDRKYIKGTPEWKTHKEKTKPRVGHPTNKVKEETEMETQLDERNKENAIKRKMMDASRGARYKVAGNPVPEPGEKHSTARAHNKAIGRALRNEETEEAPMQFTQEELQLIEQFIELAERMNLSKATMGDVIKDFKKSDAPQFAGKSDEKRRQMAIAAKLQADREAKKEEKEVTSFSGFVEALKGNQHKIDKNKNGKIDSQDFKMLRKEETEQVDENAFDWKSKKSEPSSGRYDIKRENGRTIVTRKYNPDTGHSTGTDDEPNAPKRGRGRPAGSKNRGSAK